VESVEKEESLVKKTCRELGITQKELAEKIGISESSMKRIVSSKPTKQIEKSIYLILENFKLKKDLLKVEKFQNDLKEFLYIDTSKYKEVSI
jgi:transcriptional regulator with XRE-family HTH domain